MKPQERPRPGPFLFCPFSKGAERLCRIRHGDMRPRFSLSCQRKAAAPGGKENAFVPQNGSPLRGCLFCFVTGVERIGVL